MDGDVVFKLAARFFGTVNVFAGDRMINMFTTRSAAVIKAFARGEFKKSLKSLKRVTTFRVNEKDERKKNENL